ncbi:rod shape-determining protein MreC [bacterium]|nr:rod shape-determining protein MreC [bacterium]
MRAGRTDSEFRYRIQRSERPFNWSLFRGLFLIACCLLLISLNVRSEFGDSLSSYVVLPLNYIYGQAREGVLSAGDAVARHWEAARRLGAVEAENADLRDQLTALSLEVTQYRAMAATWGLHQYFGEARTLPAAVIAVSDDPLRRTALLDRGEVHGLSKYMPVVVAGASGEPVLVGRIVEVRPYAALLLLVVDPQSAVAAVVANEVLSSTEVLSPTSLIATTSVISTTSLISTPSVISTEGRNLVHGMVRGTGEGCVVSVPRDAELSAGDLVYTSGRGVYFPPDLYLGRIAGQHPDAAGLDLVYRLEPAFRLSDLREVLILPNLYRDDAQKLGVGP